MASKADKAYFARIAQQNSRLRERLPASLQESLDELSRISRTLGLLAENRVPEGDGDLQSHLSYLRRLRLLDPNYRVTSA